MLPRGGGSYSHAPPPFTSPFDKESGFYNGGPKPTSTVSHIPQGISSPFAQQSEATYRTSAPQIDRQQWQPPLRQPPLTDPFGNARGFVPAENVSSERLRPVNTTELGDEEEGPLLQELGIVPRDIAKRMMCILTFHNVGDELLQSMDMTGPVLILMALATSLLITSKSSHIHYGHVYAMMTAGTTTLWALLNLMSSTQYLLSYHRALSVFGYGLLPMLIGSLIGPCLGRFRLYAVICSVIWSTITASRFIDEALQMRNQRFLVVYPILLFYGCFALSL